jgi:hypothetical protein
LSAGSHTFVFRGRERSTRLDAIYVTNDRNFVPGLAPASIAFQENEPDAPPTEPDTLGPFVSNLTITGINARSVALAWQTDEPALAFVEYGLTSDLGNYSYPMATLTTEHTAALTNLPPDTVCHLQIRSIDVHGNASLSEMVTVITPPTITFAWAAEDGTLVEPMKIVTDPMALGTFCVSSDSQDAGSASYLVQIPSASDYRLWCRLWTWTPGVVSFYVSVDGIDMDVYGLAEADQKGWQWVAVGNRSGGTPLTIHSPGFNLNAGFHKILFHAQEAGILLDEIVLSNDPAWMPTADID